MTDLTISDWRLIALTLDGIGPFQDGPQTFSFMGDTPAEGEAGAPGPSNLYMLLAKNGAGKSTILETIHGLFGLLANPVTGRFADWTTPGRAQLDIRATWTIDGKTSTVLLSIWTGDVTAIVRWADDRLTEEAEVSDWARLGLARGFGQIVPTEGSNDLGLVLYRAIAAAAGREPGSLFGVGPELPTVLLFPADRLLQAPPVNRMVEAPANWFYQPAHCFGSEGAHWNSSIDNLLVWLTWLDDGQLEQLLNIVNEQVFRDGGKQLRPPRRRELLTYVSLAGGGEHPLSGLSHGERALLQLWLRTLAHMTRNTILLIDEIEIHLHTRWMNLMFQNLKAMLQERPTLSIIFTTHDRELIQVFDHTRPEPKIVKGGFLISDDIA